jgi:hypothetical protein
MFVLYHVQYSFVLRKALGVEANKNANERQNKKVSAYSV